MTQTRPIELSGVPEDAGLPRIGDLVVVRGAPGTGLFVRNRSIAHEQAGSWLIGGGAVVIVLSIDSATSTYGTERDVMVMAPPGRIGWVLPEYLSEVA